MLDNELKATSHNFQTYILLFERDVLFCAHIVFSFWYPKTSGFLLLWSSIERHPSTHPHIYSCELIVSALILLSAVSLALW